MITRRTALILGAGASADFGFPLGRGLLQRVVIGIRARDANLYQVLGACGFADDHMQDFARQLDESMLQSVDAFLENRPEFMELGKAAIVAALIPYEAESNFQRPQDGPHWYEYLFQRLGPRRGDYEESKLSVVTFNYDRSFEHFLFRSLRAAFGLSDDECKPLLRRVPVVHVYGRLGALDYISLDGRRYHPDLSPQIVAKYAKEIKIVHEGRSGTPQFAQAHKLLARADVIFFLGFGYHKTNMERLRLEDAKKSAKVFGCVKGMTDAEAKEIERGFKGHFAFPKVGKGSQTILSFLRDYPAFL